MVERRIPNPKVGSSSLLGIKQLPFIFSKNFVRLFKELCSTF